MRTLASTANETETHETKVQSELEQLLALSHLIKASTEKMEVLNANLLETEQRYQSLFEHNPDVVYSMDLEGMITSANPSLTKMLGYSQDEVLGTNAAGFVPAEDQARIISKFQAAVNEQPQSYTTKICHKNGEYLLFSVTNIPIIINDEVTGVYGIGKNITWQKKAEETIARLAYHDPMTGLPNRVLLEERLAELVQQRMESKKPFAVLFIDIDQFAIINESFGHQAGDQVLQHAAAQMKSAAKDKGMLSRFSGDEFIVLVQEFKCMEEVNETVQDIQQAIALPYSLGEQEYMVTATVGVSVFPQDGTTSESLIKKAGIALHRAKKKGRSGTAFFNGEMNQFQLERLQLENYLRHALEKNEMMLYYQPQYCLKESSISGFEALIRWNHPVLGIISPRDFIPLAEEMGIISDIGRFVMLEACKQLKIWHEEGNQRLSVSVNVSGRQLQSLDFIFEVKEILESTGIDPTFLHLELTETIMIENVQHSLNIMKELKALGIKLSIDDFGTGYSALSYIKDLPIDILKIDQTFIQNLLNDGYNKTDIAIVKAIITMCQVLMVDVVAEGVETAEQMALLKQFGCQHIQGYYISKPVDREAARKLLQKR
ncbi:putative bifunctional diguanylate cyclase/phosphodiesterase [Fictibacillus iocasae]|uniref:Bifunctional diguanylate cyclase/phosphodiesterase n=1 Tax=Fictibacillus iocasae TaxID=2715437 RepID=A0ABW2NM75_9BACL